MKLSRQVRKHARPIALISITLATGMGMIVSMLLLRQNQDIRQEAAGNDIQLPSCSLPTQAGDITVLFPQDSRLFLDARAGKTNNITASSISGPSGANIPTGTYAISLESFDNHDDTIPPASSIHYQIKEQWYAVLKDASGTTISTSGTIDDLPDKQQRKSQQVNSSLQLSQTVTQVVAQHAYVPDTKPQSVYPICAVFSPLNQPTATQTPPNPTQIIAPAATATQVPATSPPQSITTQPSPSPSPTATTAPTLIPSAVPSPTVTTNPISPTTTSSPSSTATPIAHSPTASGQSSPTPSNTSPTATQAPGKACIGDFVGLDANGDGIAQSGDSGVAGVGVELYRSSEAQAMQSEQTDQAGHYSFCDLDANTYKIRFLLPSGYQFAPQAQGSDATLDSDASVATGFSQQITLSSGVSIQDIDALLIAKQNSAVGQLASNLPNASPTAVTLPQAGSNIPTVFVVASGFLILLAGLALLVL